MTLFGVILVALLTYNYIHNKDTIEKIKFTFVLDCVVYSFVNIGQFCHIGGLAIEYDYLVVVILTAQVFTLSINNRRLPNTAAFILIFLIITLSAFFLQKILPTSTGVYIVGGNEDAYIYGGYKWLPVLSGQCVKPIIRMCLFFFDAALISNVIEMKDWEDIVEKICKFSIPFLACISLEVISKNILNNTVYDIITRLLFGTTTGGWQVARGELMAIVGFRGESTTLASGLFEIGIIEIIWYRIRGGSKQTLLVLWTIVLLLCSASMVGILGAIAVSFILVTEQIRNKNSTALLLEAGLAAFLFVAIQKMDVSYFIERFQSVVNVFNNNISRATVDGSSGVRMLSVIDGWKAFLERPLVGVGVGTIVVYGATVLGLAEMGVLGVGLWIAFIKINTGIKFSRNFLPIISMLIVYTFSGDFGTYYNLTVYLIMQCLALNIFEDKSKRNIGMRESLKAGRTMYL